MINGTTLPLVGIYVQLSLPWAILLALVFGTLIGVIHGLLVCRVDLQPFLVTLCSLLIFRGLARVMTNEKSVSFDSTEHRFLAELGSGAWLGIPVPVYILIGVLIPLGLFMHQTVPGRYLYAIGYNVEAARFSGVRVDLLRTLSYALSGFLARSRRSSKRVTSRACPLPLQAWLTRCMASRARCSAPAPCAAGKVR